jgi:glucose/arabinose dehydrogenase
MKRTFFFLVAALGVAIAAKIKLPPPYHSPAVANGAKVIPQPVGSKLSVPSGFKVEEFSSGMQKPRMMLELPGGAVLVSDSIANGTVQAISADGSKKALLSGLDRPFGMALHKGHLYVAEAIAIKRYPLNVKTMAIGAGQTVVPLEGYGKGHWSRSIAFDKKGKMYVSVGSSSNIDAGDPKDRAVINVYNPDGSGHEVYAGGLRNPVSIRFHPQSGKLWTTVQERDGLGDDLVPDFFTEVKPGAFYGWPYAYIGQNEEPRHKGKAPEMVAKTIEPDVVLAAHASVMDFAFYSGKSFPAKYRGGAFIAYRGSSNRAKRFGYKIVFVPFQNGRPSGDPEDFLTGFMVGEESKEVWGRPVGLLQRRDGSLLLSEDGNNKIWRITYTRSPSA